MSYIPFNQLPDSSRLWIFAADRPLTDAEALLLTVEMNSFIQTWLAHGMPVIGSCELRYNQFLCIAADESQLPTGCSTDEMTRRVRILGENYGVEFLGMPKVYFRDHETIRTMSRAEFAELAKAGAANSATIVFDNTLMSVGQLREGKWELPARESWHSKAFEFQS